MKITINGEEHEIVDPATIVDVIRVVGRTPEGKGIAVALNGDVVVRSEWPSTEIKPGDMLEVLSAIGGG